MLQVSYGGETGGCGGSDEGEGEGGGGGRDLIKKKTGKCKPEAMHSTGRHECIFILYAKPGSTSRHTLTVRKSQSVGVSNTSAISVG